MIAGFCFFLLPNVAEVGKLGSLPSFMIQCAWECFFHTSHFTLPFQGLTLSLRSGAVPGSACERIHQVLRCPFPLAGEIG